MHLNVNQARHEVRQTVSPAVEFHRTRTIARLPSRNRVRSQHMAALPRIAQELVPWLLALIALVGYVRTYRTVMLAIFHAIHHDKRWGLTAAPPSMSCGGP